VLVEVPTAVLEAMLPHRYLELALPEALLRAVLDRADPTAAAAVAAVEFLLQGMWRAAQVGPVRNRGVAAVAGAQPEKTTTPAQAAPAGMAVLLCIHGDANALRDR
jgi:hypothetical protein